MATTATVFTLAGAAFPFIGIGIAPAQYITSLPSAEFTFMMDAGAVTVAAAGEDQSIEVICPLPRSFCYVLVECIMTLTSNAADDWDKACRAALNDSASVGINRLAIPLQMTNTELGHSSALTFQRDYQVKPVPSKLIIPQTQDNASLNVKLRNVVIDGNSGTLRFYARFLRYDRNQAQHWQVHTPVLIR